MIVSKTNMASNRDYYSKILKGWCMKLKLKMFMAIFIKNKEMFYFGNYSAKSKYYDDSNVLVVGRPSQIACTITTVHVTCMQLALHVHENACTVLIENTIENYLLAAHTDHYALRK